MRLISKYFRSFDPVLLLLAGLMVLLYVRVANGGFPLDDSWIHQVYGRNLAQTGQWAFIPGEISAASTSPLYTVLLAIGYALNMPYTFWPHLLGWLALAITGMLGARMAAHLLPKSRFSGWAAGLALVMTWHLIWAAASGMETMLFSMFTLALIAMAWRELDNRSEATGHGAIRGACFGVLAALATLTRPEGVALAGLVGLTLLILRPQGFRTVVIWGVAAVLGFLVTMSPYLIFNLQLTGGLLPDTAAAKQAEAALILANVSYPERVWQMVKPILAGGQVLLLLGVVYYAALRLSDLRRDWRALVYLLPVLWAVFLILLYAARLPAPYQHGRYVIPTLPSLVLVGVVGSLELLRLGQRRLITRVLTRTLALSTMLVFVYYALISGPAVYSRDVRIIDEEMVASALWIVENIPPEELLAVHDIGAIGFFAPRPIVDIAGLISPEVVPFILDEEPLWAYLQAQDARYLLAFPDQVPGDDIEDRRLCPIFTTNNPTAVDAGGANMTLYALAWNGACFS